MTDVRLSKNVFNWLIWAMLGGFLVYFTPEFKISRNILAFFVVGMVLPAFIRRRYVSGFAVLSGFILSSVFFSTYDISLFLSSVSVIFVCYIIAFVLQRSAFFHSSFPSISSLVFYYIVAGVGGSLAYASVLLTMVWFVFDEWHVHLGPYFWNQLFGFSMGIVTLSVFMLTWRRFKIAGIMTIIKREAQGEWLFEFFVPLVLAAVCVYWSLNGYYNYIFLILLPGLWISYRFGRRGASIFTSLVAVIVAVAIMGPQWNGLKDHVVDLARIQIIFAVISFSCMFLAVAKETDEAKKMKQTLATRLRKNKAELEKTQEKLVKCQEHLRLIFSGAPTGIIHCEADGRIIQANQRFAEIFGYLPQECVGRFYQDFSFPDERSSDDVELHNIKSLQSDYVSREKLCQHKTGKPIWVNSIVSAASSSEGAVRSIIVVIVDIDTRKRAEESLQDTHRSYKRMIAAMPHITFVYDFVAQKLIYVNPRAYDVLGLTVEQLLLMSRSEILARMHPDDIHSLERARLKFIEKGARDPYSVEFRLLCGDGPYSWFDVRAVVLSRLADGSIERMIGVAQDITDTKAVVAEKERLLSKATLQTNQLHKLNRTSLTITSALTIPGILQVSVDQARVLVGSHQAYITYWPSRNLESGESAGGETFYFSSWSNKYQSLDADKVKNLSNAFSDLVKYINKPVCMTSEELQSNYLFRDVVEYSRNFSYLLKGILLAPLFDKSGKITGFVYLTEKFEEEYNQDDLYILIQMSQIISAALINAALYEEREHAEREARNARNQALAASKEKSSFIANLSHEIRTPLGIIMGFADLVLDQKLNPQESQKHIKTIRRNAEHLAQLINEILDLSKIESGRFELDINSCNIVEMVDDLTAPFAYRANHHGVSLHVEFSQNVPSFIGTDAGRVRQILVNLLSNAFKFTEYGEVRLKVSLHQAADNQKLIIDVQDTGIGIAEKQQQNLFQPYMQAEQSIAKKFGGTGLGLVLSQRLARALGGDLYLVSSSLGKGALFRFELPFVPVQSSDQPDLVANQLAGGAENSSQVEQSSKNEPRLRNLRILIVEDGLDNQMLFSHILSASGADVDLANDGEMAVNKAKSRKYDAILMDLQMPILDGFSATRRLREIGINIPIIALTARAMKEDVEESKLAGFNDYITKPVNKRELIQKISELVTGASINYAGNIQH